MGKTSGSIVPGELVTARVAEVVATVSRALDEAGVGREPSGLDATLERLFALSPYAMERCRRDPASLARLLREGALTSPGAGREALVAELLAEFGPSVAPESGAASGRPEGPGAASASDPSDAPVGEDDRADVPVGRPSGTLAVTSADALVEIPEAVALAAFRRFRHRHMLRILWRELDGSATLDDTLGDLTRLAEASVTVATALAEATERRRSGTPRDADGREQRLIVLGMGKLGGGELNVSSDIDLICLWPAPGKTDGRRALDNGEHFVRVVRHVVRLLGATTADGFAFRVDTRLRPFGESGPLAMHLDAFENYLLTQGRDWERYAMIKARALTGEPADIAQFEALRRPFVYRRYVDYDALVSLAVLKDKIRHSVAVRRERREDVKLGPGGIRELEFTGQALQLMRGGREPALQLRPIRDVLRALGEHGLIPQGEVRALIDAYGYLRRVENALQGMRDEQTHVLPEGGEDRLRLVAMLGEPDEATFRETLEGHRTVVTRSFGSVLGEAGASEAEGKVPSGGAAGGDGAGAILSIAGLEPVDAEGVAAAWLERHGIETEPALVERLLALAGGPFHRRLTARAQHRIEQLLPRLAAAAMASGAVASGPTGEADGADGTDGVDGADGASGSGAAGAPGTTTPEIALARALDFVRAVAGRSGYLQALADRPAALARLLRLFAASEWVANLVTRHPITVDELIGQSAATLFTDAASVREEALAEAARLAGHDLERQMDALRHFRHARELRIAAAALDGELPPMQASDRLSWLAEALVAAAIELVSLPLRERYGEDLPELVVIAYGKLGGLELGFGSDLDLVFLRGEDGKAEPATRLVRRFTHFMGTMTPAGRVHEIDLRLRPNGSSGVLVGTLDSFEAYQHEQAWTWEHQALLRARAVHGPAALRSRFETVRRAVLCRPRDPERLRVQVASMRERMREALGTRGGSGSGAEGHPAGGRMHLKQDAGGIADIEFVVQYLALRHAADAPSLVRFTDNVRVLEEAGRLGLLAMADVSALRDDYVALRERLHRRSLALDDAVAPLDPSLVMLRERVVERRERLLGTGDPTSVAANAHVSLPPDPLP